MCVITPYKLYSRVQGTDEVKSVGTTENTSVIQLVDQVKLR